VAEIHLQGDLLCSGF